MGDEPVRLRLDTFAVQNWLSAHGHDVQTVRVLAQFGAGQSNPTYLLLCIGPSGQSKLVLRRKPPGELLPSAHDVVREHRVMAALQGTGVPVPRVRGLCTSEFVLGVPFYVMDYVAGRVLTDERLPGMQPEERTATWTNVVQTLAALHSVDYRTVGLEKHGKVGGGGYALRQLEVWSRQFGAVDGLVRAHGAVNGAVDLQPSPSPSRSLSRSPSPNPSPNTNPSPYPNLTAALAKASDEMLRLQAWLPTRIPTVPVSLSQP